MIERIILSSNENTSYLQYWPLVARAWDKLLGIKPDLAFITDRDPEEFRALQEHGTVHKFDPIDGMPSANQAKISRLFLAAQYPDCYCLLSDIDLLPLSPKPFRVIKEKVQMRKVVCFGADAFANVDLDANPGHGAFPISYLCAKGRVFRSLFSVDDLPQTKEYPDEWRANPYRTPHEFSDEALLRRCGIADLIVPIARGWGRFANRRIDRSGWYVDWSSLLQGYYYDAHLPHKVEPYYKIEQLIDPKRNPYFR
jgi:hypothetical protein